MTLKKIGRWCKFLNVWTYILKDSSRNNLTKMNQSYLEFDESTKVLYFQYIFNTNDYLKWEDFRTIGKLITNELGVRKYISDGESKLDKKKKNKYNIIKYQCIIDDKISEKKIFDIIGKIDSKASEMCSTFQIQKMLL